MRITSKIQACGSYLPKKVITNADLEKIVETSDEWITERTGIKQRHIAADNELSSDLAFNAARDALANSSVTNNDIDLIIVATTTPDNTFPSTATKLQSLLNITKGAAFDIQAVCAGFLYALVVADQFIKSGQARHVLVVGVDVMSRLLDWQDRSTCVLFGDGAGAVVISANTSNDAGIIGSNIYSDGSFRDILYTDGGVCSSNNSGKVKMAGKEVFRHAVEKMSGSITSLLTEHNLKVTDIDVLVPHQANIRIIEGLARKLGVPDNKIVCTVQSHANTSAASIPLALDYAVKNNMVKPGDKVLLSAIGGGLCWGSSLIKW